jgi:uncharacterized membrane protein YecN with MAPEG domain
MITGFYAGLLGAWLIFLLLSVVRQRLKHKVGLSHGGKKELLKSIRIHGNFIETVPYILLLMLLLESLEFAPWLIHTYGILLILSRLFHWNGISNSTAMSFGRKAGTIIVVFLIGFGSLLLVADFGFKMLN